eukprot:TRINITY_DN20113_c0_g1_i1.p1 TRINITY_DN20113_c0_g1~~TRINITY_DN20113_c0_g1_i1.p1  ORF type:complete len:116 (-),score=19.16 TRINITY_DN20113_c0_g1_i1:284-631(-)
MRTEARQRWNGRCPSQFLRVLNLSEHEVVVSIQNDSRSLYWSKQIVLPAGDLCEELPMPYIMGQKNAVISARFVGREGSSTWLMEKGVCVGDRDEMVVLAAGVEYNGSPEGGWVD